MKEQDDKFKIPRSIKFIYVIMVIFPMVMYLFVDLLDFRVNHIDESVWLSFWGTYVGACLSCVIMSLTLIYSLRQFKEVQKEDKDKYQEDVKRQLLIKYRPLITFEEIDIADKKFVDVHRYVYMNEEQNWDSLENYHHEKVVSFKLKNIGLGAAEGITISYESSSYGISGFDDRIIQERKKDSAKLYQKMSIDIAGNDFMDVNLHIHCSDGFTNPLNLYMKQITMDINYEDLRHNKLSRSLTMDIQSGKIVGWGNQNYVNDELQKLFLAEF